MTRFVALGVAAIALTACNRDPNYLKQKYLESGNKYFAAKRYKEASIMYRKSLEKDRRFGPAWYHLALTDLQLNDVANSVYALRRAAELLPPGTPDADDASFKIAELEIVGANQPAGSNDQLVRDVQQIRDGFLKRNPNSWQGHKLSGDLDMLAFGAKLRRGETADLKAQVTDAVAEYRKALNAKGAAASNAGTGNNDTTIRIALGHALEANAQPGDAETLFRDIVGRDKHNLQAYSELFRLYAAQRKTDQAEGILKQAIQNNPKDSGARLTLAGYYLSQGKKDQYIALLDQMKSDLKDFPQAYIQAGDFYLRTGSFDNAIREYEEGIAKDSAHKNTYLKREIDVYAAQRKMDVALQKNQQVLKNDPKDADARQLDATLMLDKGEVDKAIAELQAVVRDAPSNFLAHYNLGRAHVIRGEDDQARQEFEKAVQARPDYIPARLSLADTTMRMGDNEQALRDAEEIVKLAPNSLQGRVMEAAALRRLSRFSEAQAVLTQILQQAPNQPDALGEMGILQLAERKPRDAEQTFAKSYAAQPGNLKALVGESTAYRMDGQAEKSIQVIAAEAAKNPQNIELQRELGNAQYAAGRYDDAIATYNALVPKATTANVKGDLLERVGQAYRMKRDPQASIAALEQASKQLPNNSVILTNLGELYSDQNNFQLSRQYYESALKADPNNPVALNNLAYLIADTNGDLDLALTYATRAKQRLPDNNEITDTIGWIYLKKKLTDSALDTYRQLIAKAPQNPLYHYHYAVALSEKGDRDTARRECQTALSDKPNQSQEQQIRRLMQQIS